MKRLLLALAGGLVCSAICFTGRKILIPDITWPALMASAVGNRMLIGFVIGISRLKINFLLHGALIGFLVTFSFSMSMLPGNISGFLVYTAMGTLFGLLIETFVTKICKAGNYGT